MRPESSSSLACVTPRRGAALAPRDGNKGHGSGQAGLRSAKGREGTEGKAPGAARWAGMPARGTWARQGKEGGQA